MSAAYTEELTAKVLSMTVEQYRAYNRSDAPRLAAKAARAQAAGATTKQLKKIMKERDAIIKKVRANKPLDPIETRFGWQLANRARLLNEAN